MPAPSRARRKARIVNRTYSVVDRDMKDIAKLAAALKFDDDTP